MPRIELSKPKKFLLHALKIYLIILIILLFIKFIKVAF